MILVSALCPLAAITGSNVVYHLSALWHFCDTSDCTAELQKHPDKALDKKLGVRKCNRYLGESLSHITLLYYEI